MVRECARRSSSHIRIALMWWWNVLRLLLWSSATAEAAVCGTNGLDLSALTSATGSYRVKDAQGYSYAFNVCGVVMDEPECRAQQGLMCQYSGSKLEAVVAKWDAGAVTWSALSSSGGEGGLLGTTSNGDTCYPVSTPRTTRLTFLCDPAADLQVVNLMQPATNPCEYDLTVKTKWACAGTAAPDGASSHALSGGWVFVILVLVLSAVYVAGGCLWNYKFHPTSAHYFPHLDSWKYLVGLVQDGCRFSWKKLRKQPPAEYTSVV